MNLPTQPLTALRSVPTEPLDDESRQWAPDFKSDPLWDATTRVLKAALLYADDVQFAGWSSGEWIAGWNVGTWSARFLSKETAWDRFDHAQWHAGQARLIRAANEPPKSGWSNDIQVPVIRAGASWRWWRDPESQLHATWHGALASSLLLGALDAYPDAEMDVILDVRERIATARTHLRAAMAAATSGLAHDGEPPSPQALAELRLREVDPAVAILRDEIDALGVKRTLLRMTSDRVLVGASGTALAVTVGATGSLLKALGAAVAPLVAAGAKEAEDRKKTVAELRHRPFWALHEMVDELRRRA